MTLLAATARTDITPPIGITHTNWGAAAHDQAEGVDLPLWATAFVARGPDQTTVAVVDLDFSNLSRTMCERLRSHIHARTGIPPEYIRISCSHTHSGPTITPSWSQGGADRIEPYVHALPDRIAGIVWEASRRLVPVTVQSASGPCPVNVNRRQILPDGRVVVGRNPDGFVDPELIVLRFERIDGSTLATFANFACHPTIMAHLNRLITPDYPGVVRRVVEEAVGGHCLFLQGAAGNQCSVEDLTSRRESYHRIGRAIGFAAAHLAVRASIPRMEFDTVLESGAPLALYRVSQPKDPDDSVRAVETPVSLPVREFPPAKEIRQAYEEYKQRLAALRAGGGTEEEVHQTSFMAKRLRQQLRLAELTAGKPSIDIPVQVIRLGHAALVALPVEAFAEVGVAVKKRSPFSPTLVSGYSNGSFGYLPTADAFEEGGYETHASPFHPSASDTLVEELLRLLESFR